MKNLPIAMLSPNKKTSAEIAAFVVFVLCVLCSFSTSAQSNQVLSKTNQYLDANQKKLGLTDFDLAELTVTDSYTDDHNGVTHRIDRINFPST